MISSMVGTWTGSALGALALCVFLYLPGFLALLKTRFAGALGFACSPLCTVFVYALLAIVYGKAGIACTWWKLFLPCLALAVIVFLLMARRARCKEQSDLPSWRTGLGTLPWYIIWSCLMVAHQFLPYIDGPNAFIQIYDNVYHLDVLQTFIDTHDWSILSVSPYFADQVAPLEVVQGFYPAVWHLLGAMTASVTGLPVAQVANIVNGICMGVVFPASMYGLMTTMFPENALVVRVGALLTVAFGVFPWFLVVWGPLFANLVSLSLVPMLAAVFMRLAQRIVKRESFALELCLFIVGSVSVACSQPNGIFTTAAFLAPWLIALVYRTVKREGAPCWRPVGAAAVATVLVVAVWYMAFTLPPLQDVIWYPHDAVCSKMTAVEKVLGLTFDTFVGGSLSQEPVLAVLVICGVLVVLSKRANWWLVASYAVLAAIYCASASCQGFIQHFLAGFWYSDPPRTAASLVLCIVPLASVFVAWLIELVSRIATKWLAVPTANVLASVLVLVPLVVGLYGFEETYDAPENPPNAFGDIFRSATYHYGPDNRPLDGEEMAFVQKVQGIVGNDELIVNQPFDGSTFAGSVYGLNVYYRSINSHGDDRETDESKLLRLDLDDYASNGEVKEALDKIGSRYVLVLDYNDPGEASPAVYPRNPDEWTGIDGVRDDTPGFKTILSEGDMRLYEVVE